MLKFEFGIPRMVDFVAHYRARGLTKFQAFSLWKLASTRQPRKVGHLPEHGAEKVTDRDIRWAMSLKR